MAASPLPSQVAKRGWLCYLTPKFPGIPRQENKIRIGCLTRAFSGAQKRAELLCNRCNLGGPKTRKHNQKWLPHRCLLGGPRRAQYSYVTLALAGVPKQGEKIKTGYLSLAFSGGPEEGAIDTYPLRS